MINVSIKITKGGLGLPKTNAFAKKLLKEIPEDVLIEFSKSMKRSAKLRAPFFTGFLRSSIDYVRERKNVYKVGVFGKAARYALFQEKGYTPHVIPVEYIDIHASSPGTIGNRQLVESMDGPSSFVNVSGHKPFLEPAFNITRSRLPVIIRRAIKNNV